jgi:hypothetical protein
MPLSQVFTHVYQPWNNFGYFFYYNFETTGRKENSKENNKRGLTRKESKSTPALLFHTSLFRSPLELIKVIKR